MLNKWKNEFTFNYIENLTQKTGNSKKFDIFVKMLLTAISQTSDSVLIDIMT